MKRCKIAAAVCAAVMMGTLSMHIDRALLSDKVIIAHAQTSGTCGENIMWTFDDEGTLTISGTGKMRFDDNFDDNSLHLKAIPWWSIRESIRMVIIENGVTHIESCAFEDCTNLTTINIPASVTSIGSYAFCGCTNLISVTIPDGVTSIEEYTFSGCENLASVSIPDSVTNIGNSAFCNCMNLNDVNITNSVTSIGSAAFFNCTGLTSMTIPESVTSIGIFAYGLCTNLSSVTLPDGLTRIEEDTFAFCTSLISIIIPDEVTSIGRGAFKECTSLKTVTIPDSVTSIEASAFSGCISLKTVVVPQSVESIGKWAFDDCGSADGIDSEFIILGLKGSAAEEYATKNFITFEELNAAPTETKPAEKLTPGDANNDKTINILDVIAVNKHLLGAAELTGVGKYNADVDGKSGITAEDSLLILKYALEIIESFQV